MKTSDPPRPAPAANRVHLHEVIVAGQDWSEIFLFDAPQGLGPTAQLRSHEVVADLESSTASSISGAPAGPGPVTGRLVPDTEASGPGTETQEARLVPGTPAPMGRPRAEAQETQRPGTSPVRRGDRPRGSMRHFAERIAGQARTLVGGRPGTVHLVAPEGIREPLTEALEPLEERGVEVRAPTARDLSSLHWLASALGSHRPRWPAIRRVLGLPTETSA